MRIAFMTDSYHPTVDGMVSMLESFQKSLEELGHEVFIIAPDPGEEYRREGVYYFPSVEFPSYKGYYIPIFPSNKIEILRKINPDVIHAHGMTLMALKGIIAAHTLKVPYIITMGTMVADTLEFYLPHLPTDIMEKLTWIYLRQLINHADGMITYTNTIMDELRSHGITSRDPRIMTGAIDLSIFHPVEAPQELKDRLDLNGRRVVMHVGRMSFEKHIDDIVRALADLPDDVVLVIVGDGPSREEVEKVTDELGYRDRVRFTGFVDRKELPKYYALADVCVSNSMFETQGLTTMEAMACRKPIVCPDARAFKELIHDGVDGFKFEGGNVKALAARINDALDCDDELRQTAMDYARSFSETGFAEFLVDLYTDAIKAKKERLAAKEKRRWRH